MLAKNSHNSYKKYHPVPNKTRNNHGQAKKSTDVSKHKKTVKTGGRSSTGVIGSAIAAALVPFGLFATQKNVQSSLPSSSYKKKSKRRGQNGQSYKGKSYKGKSYKGKSYKGKGYKGKSYKGKGYKGKSYRKNSSRKI